MDLFTLIAGGIMVLAIVALLFLLARYLLVGNDSKSEKEDIS